MGGEPHNGMALSLVPRRRGWVQRHLDLFHASQLHRVAGCRGVSGNVVVVCDGCSQARNEPTRLCLHQGGAQFVVQPVPWKAAAQSKQSKQGATCQAWVGCEGNVTGTRTHAPGDEQPRVGVRAHDAHGAAAHFDAVQVLDSRLCAGCESRGRPHETQHAISPRLTPHRRSAQTQSLCRRRSPCLASSGPAVTRGWVSDTAATLPSCPSRAPPLCRRPPRTWPSHLPPSRPRPGRQ